jgi:hypothetical protein
LKIAIMGSGGIGGYYAQRVEVDAKEVRIMGSKSVLLRTLVAASSAKTAGFGVRFLYRSGAPRSTKMALFARRSPTMPQLALRERSGSQKLRGAQRERGDCAPPHDHKVNHQDADACDFDRHRADWDQRPGT